MVDQGGYVPGWDGATQGDAWCYGGAGTWGPLLGAIARGEEVGGKRGLWVPVKFRTQWAGGVPCARGPEPGLPRGTDCASRDGHAGEAAARSVLRFVCRVCLKRVCCWDCSMVPAGPRV